MSGNRWSARLKGRARRRRDRDSVFDRAIEGGLSKLDRQRWRRRGERGADRRSGHADRAEIVGLAIVRMVRRLATVGRSNDQAMLGAVAADRVDVAEG